MPQKAGNKLRRLTFAAAAFFIPIIVGAVVVKTGGYVAFWLLSYYLMLLIPVVLVVYLVYKYISHVAAEKVEERNEGAGREFLVSLEAEYGFIDEILWDRTFRGRSRLSRRRPFDRVAVAVHEEWTALAEDERERAAFEIVRRLHDWIGGRFPERKGFPVRVDFYRDVSEPVPEDSTGWVMPEGKRQN